MFKNILVLLVLVLPGCAQFDVMKKVIAEDGATAKDGTLEAAEWYICSAASVGSIKRKYQTPEAIAAYNEICGDTLPTIKPGAGA